MGMIGILGGMSAASTLQYYELLCELTTARLGGLHGPRLLIRSCDFAQIARLQNQGAWAALGERLAERARDLEAGGADVLLLTTNTMHKVAPRMMRDVSIPLIHIADAAADAILAGGFSHPGLIGTRFTMEDSFYLDRIKARGLQPIVPEREDRELVHTVIYEELCQHTVLPESREAFVRVTRELKQMGADCVILGCTEVGLLLDADNSALPVFDTTRLHCEAAIDAALALATK